VSHCWTAFPQHQPGNNCNQKETDNLKSGGGDPNGNARLAKKNGKKLDFFSAISTNWRSKSLCKIQPTTQIEI
jgi:hypothetical protein